MFKGTNSTEAASTKMGLGEMVNNLYYSYENFRLRLVLAGIVRKIPAPE